MPLQLRRGTTAERLSIVPLPGEPIYDTDLDTIFIGNGIAAGGISAITGITSEDAQDIVGQMFVNGQHDNIVFTYGSTQDAANRIDVRLDLSGYDGEISASGFRGSLFADDSTLLVDAVTGTIPYAVLSGAPTAVSDFANDLGFISVADISDGTVTIDVNNTGDLQGSVFADNSTILVDATNSAINLDGTVKGDIIPDANEAYDLGSNANRFKDLYLSGTSLFLGSAQITAAGSAVNLPAGSTVDGVSIGTGSGTGDGVVAGSNYNINIVGDDSTLIVDSDLKIFTGSLIGNVTGNVTGDVKGSVFADDSSLLVDAVDRIFTGNLVGNITTSIITSSDSSAINIIPPVIMNTDLFVDSDVFADNFVGKFQGPVTGNITTNFISSADSSPILFGVPASFSSRITVDDDITMNNGGTLLLNSNESTSNLQIATHSDSDLPGVILMRRSRGTAASPTALQTNDRIHALNFNAFDGNNYIGAANIQARIEGTVSTGVVPTSLRFIIRDSIGDEVEGLRIDQFGSVRFFRAIYANAPDGFSNYTNLRLSNHHASGTEAGNFAMQRSRGTLDSPSTVFDGDPMYDISFRGYDGSNYINSANIRGVVDGTVSTGVVPGRLDFVIRGSSGAIPVTSQFSAVKAVFNTMLQLPTFADETAADTAIGGSGNRVNGMMYYDTALSAVRAVVGGSWTSL